MSLPRARQELTELARSHLITEPLPGRLAFHDLLRAYAAEQAAEGQPRADRHEAVRRVLDYYVLTSHATALLLNPRGRRSLCPARRRA